MIKPYLLSLNPGETNIAKIVSVSKQTSQFINSASQIVNVKHFGAVGDGSADDTTAIATAISGTPAGGTLFFPTGVYKVTAGFTFTQPINILGAGESTSTVGSVFKPVGLSGVTSLFTVSTTVFTPGWTFKNFSVLGDGSGGYAIEFVGIGGWYMVLIDNLTIQGMGLNYSIGVTGNAAPGFSFSTISNCNLVGGIFIRYGGDGLHIENNIINTAGSGYGIYFNNVSGAAGFVIAKNVIAGPVQLLSIDNAISPVIFANEFESLISATSSYVVRIGGGDIVASVAAVNQGPLFINNHISVLGGTNPRPLYFNNCFNASAKGGGYLIQNPGVPVHIEIGSGATRTYIDLGNSVTYITNSAFAAASILDNGVTTHLDIDFPGGATSVASLPAAATTIANTRYMVLDSAVAAATNFGTIVATSTSTAPSLNIVPVYNDGANWRIG